MKCPACGVAMIRGEIWKCRTGDAQKFICPLCRAHHWHQLTQTVEMNFRPLREINQKVALQSV